MANVKITDLTSGTTLVGTELFEAVQSATSVKLTSDQVKAFANSAPTLLVETSNTNTPATAATLSHETDGTPTAGIGTRLDFICQTSTSNTEIGARVTAVTTNVGAGTEAFDLLIQLMTGGALPTEVAKITGTGNLSITGDKFIIAGDNTPASAAATGTAGTICWDSSYIYVCVATDTWKRVAISTW